MKKPEKSYRGIAMFGVIFLVLSLVFPIVSGGGSPFTVPHTLQGKVCYSDGDPVVGASITLINKTGNSVQTETGESGEWRKEISQFAQTGEEILITVSINAEETQSRNIVVTNEEPQVVGDFIFEKHSEAGPPGSGGGSPTSDDFPSDEPKENVTDEERGKENISEQQPSPSPSGIEEKGNESVAGEGEKPSPTKEGDKRGDEGKGKSKSIPGFQFMYAGAAGLTAIAALFIIRMIKIKLRGEGGEEKR